MVCLWEIGGYCIDRIVIISLDVGDMLRGTLQLLGFPSLVVHSWLVLMTVKMYTVKRSFRRQMFGLNGKLKLHLQLNIKPYFWSVVCVLVHSFIHSEFCLTTGPKPPPKRCLHTVRCRASSFKWEYPLLSLRSSSSFLRLLPRLLATSISPFIFPSITCFRRQFLRKMWPSVFLFRVGYSSAHWL